MKETTYDLYIFHIYTLKVKLSCYIFVFIPLSFYDFFDSAAQNSFRDFSKSPQIDHFFCGRIFLNICKIIKHNFSVRFSACWNCLSENKFIIRYLQNIRIITKLTIFPGFSSHDSSSCFLRSLLCI